MCRRLAGLGPFGSNRLRLCTNCMGLTRASLKLRCLQPNLPSPILVVLVLKRRNHWQPLASSDIIPVVSEDSVLVQGIITSRAPVLVVILLKPSIDGTGSSKATGSCRSGGEGRVGSGRVELALLKGEITAATTVSGRSLLI